MHWLAFMGICNGLCIFILEIIRNESIKYNSLSCVIIYRFRKYGTDISGYWIKIDILSHQYRKSHCGDRTVIKSFYLYNGISILVRWYCNIESILDWWSSWLRLIFNYYHRAEVQGSYKKADICHFLQSYSSFYSLIHYCLIHIHINNQWWNDKVVSPISLQYFRLLWVYIQEYACQGYYISWLTSISTFHSPSRATTGTDPLPITHQVDPVGTWRVTNGTVGSRQWQVLEYRTSAFRNRDLFPLHPLRVNDVRLYNNRHSQKGIVISICLLGYPLRMGLCEG